MTVVGDGGIGIGGRWACLVAALALLSACGSSAASDASVTTAGAVFKTGAAGGGQGGGGATPVSRPPTTPPATTQPPTTPPATTEPSTTVAPAPPYFGPYEVKQIETLGDETISGTVCDVRQPFQVGAVTPKAAWAFAFVPSSTQHSTKGGVSYAYSIPSAGESHAATGTYTLSEADPDGTRHVSLRVSDHVVFHGFDGPIPVRYRFDLVPAGSCG